MEVYFEKDFGRYYNTSIRESDAASLVERFLL